MSQASIKYAAAALCAAITEHAALCEDDPENAPMIAPLTGKIHELVRKYGTALRDISGWSNPLLGIPKETPVSDSDLVEEIGDDPTERCWVSVVDQHALFVNDPDALVNHAEERIGEKFETVVEALLALLSADGWKPEAYPGQVIESDWRSTDACIG
ncbi:hypothetical protein [Embleya hyalina]|uniref:hypothetical protein n=1 Tax=Embleya hyalina TaxID=516124 RepID=UPI000F8498A7|nr:hypothetical protein [Embleya hyalina]